LQARKRELAGSLYDEEGQALAQVGEKEVAALLAPLAEPGDGAAATSAEPAVAGAGGPVRRR